MKLEEEKLLIEAARRDPEFFGEIFDQYYQAILNYSIKRTGNVAVAQDVVSETFFIALRKLWQFRWQGAPFSSWLYRIATNEINKFFRERQKYRPVDWENWLKMEGQNLENDESAATELKNAEAKIAQKKQFSELRKAVENLPKKYQEVIALKYFGEKSIAEIAEILGKKEGTLKSLLSRGRNLLAAKLENSECNPKSKSAF